MKTLSIGRDANNQIVLNDNFVSRKHAQLIISDNGQVLIKDLSSNNGTFVNGKRIKDCYLKPGDTVKCGDVFLNWEQYALNTPISTSSSVIKKQPESISTSNNQRDSSHSADLPKKLFNEVEANYNQNQPKTNIHSNYDQRDFATPFQQNVIVVGKAKSVGIAGVLAFFFGPLGLLYASVTGGIVMFILYIPILIITLGIGVFFIHPICVIWAVVAANQANAALQNKAGGLINNNFQR